MLESLFNEASGLQLHEKETCEICEIFKNNYFEEHLRRTTSEII